MNTLKTYLEYLTGKTESIFPIDSISSGKPFKMPVNEEDEEIDEDEDN